MLRENLLISRHFKELFEENEYVFPTRDRNKIRDGLYLAQVRILHAVISHCQPFPLYDGASQSPMRSLQFTLCIF